MPKDAKWSNPVGGMFVFVWLNERINTRKMLYDVIQKYGVAYVPGSSFYVNGIGWNTMRLNFTYPTEEKIVEGVKLLSQAIKEEQNKL
jgi:2-aminoadipate transaminase